MPPSGDQLQSLELGLTAALHDLRASLADAEREKAALCRRQLFLEDVCRVAALIRGYHCDDCEEDDEAEQLLRPLGARLLGDDAAGAADANDTVSGTSCTHNNNDWPPAPQQAAPTQQHRDQGRGEAAAAAAAADRPADWPADALSPWEQPMLFFYELLKLGPLPGAESWTLDDLLSQYAGSVKEGRLWLSLLEREEEQQQEAERRREGAQQQLQQLLQRQRQPGALGDPRGELTKEVIHYLHTWTSLVTHGRGDLLLSLHLSNCMTGERVEQQSPAPYARAARSIGLTRAQQLRMTERMGVVRELQQATLDELQRLQLQPPPAEPPNGPGAGPDGAGGGGSGAGSVKLPMGMLAQRSPHERIALEREQRVHKLRALLRKQHLLGVVFNATAIGCMTPVQVAKLGWETFPFPAFAFMLVAEVEKLLQEEAGEEKGGGVQGGSQPQQPQPLASGGAPASDAP